MWICDRGRFTQSWILTSRSICGIVIGSLSEGVRPQAKDDGRPGSHWPYDSQGRTDAKSLRYLVRQTRISRLNARSTPESDNGAGRLALVACVFLPSSSFRPQLTRPNLATTADRRDANSKVALGRAQPGNGGRQSRRGASGRRQPACCPAADALQSLASTASVFILSGTSKEPRTRVDVPWNAVAKCRVQLPASGLHSSQPGLEGAVLARTGPPWRADRRVRRRRCRRRWAGIYAGAVPKVTNLTVLSRFETAHSC